MFRGDQPAEPEWLAKPSGACCLKGHLHSGEPKGTFERLAGVETYVSKPDASRSNGHIVLYLPDVFGFFTNTLLVCDAYADAGYTVLAMDYFNGVSFCFTVESMSRLVQLTQRTGSNLHASQCSKAAPRRLRL